MNKAPIPIRIVLRLGRLGKKTLPMPLRKFLEKRVFYAIFHATRVTNDAYGWRPSEQEDS